MWNSSISNGFVIPCLIYVLKYSNLKTCKNRTVSLDAQIPVTFLLLFLVSNDGLVQNIMHFFFFLSETPVECCTIINCLSSWRELFQNIISIHDYKRNSSFPKYFNERESEDSNALHFQVSYQCIACNIRIKVCVYNVGLVVQGFSNAVNFSKDLKDYHVSKLPHLPKTRMKLKSKVR